MSQPTPTTRVSRKRQAKTREIYDTAARLFAERGYHATRIQDIANALDMNKGSLYYYFSGKEELLMQIVESRVGDALTSVRAIMERDDPVLEKLQAAVQEHLRLFHTDAAIFSIFQFEKLNTINQQAAEAVDRLGRDYEQLWLALVKDGIRAGVFRKDLEPKVLVKAIMGMCNQTLIWFNPNGRLDIRQIGEIYTAFILGGLKQE
jgi:TetR/AcrR family transcriptional regulator, cholesterol catabolism regulator